MCALSLKFDNTLMKTMPPYSHALYYLYYVLAAIYYTTKNEHK